jgi:stage V sporulation protein SpoVS
MGKPTGLQTHVGVKEFTAAEGSIVLPQPVRPDGIRRRHTPTASTDIIGSQTAVQAMRALAIDPVMCSRDGTDTTVELTFVQLKKARLNRNRIGY